MKAEVGLFKALAESTRLRLVTLLAAHGETCVCRLAAALGAPQFRISRHLGILRDRGVVEARREGVWMHYRLAVPRCKLEACLHDCLKACLVDDADVRRDRQRLAASAGTGCPVGGPAPAVPKACVLFLCTGNSCRSQMAEGWARAMWSDQLEAYSAGIETHGLNPNAVKAMAEAGVDISGHRSKLVDDLKEVCFDLVVTVCGHAHESCPIFAGGTKVIHVGFDDPPKLAESATGEPAKLDCYRRVRDQIKAFVETLPTLLGSAGSAVDRKAPGK